MAVLKGRDILLKISDGLSPGTFTSVGGFRTTTLTINNETVDITTKDEAPWRQLLSNTGLRSITFEGEGVFKDDSAINSIEILAMNGNSQEFQIVFGNGDLYQGIFLLTKLEQAGEYNAEQTYSISLESAGIVTLLRA
jgi:TP901-1 family phage major tail protein